MYCPFIFWLFEFFKQIKKDLFWFLLLLPSIVQCNCIFFKILLLLFCIMVFSILLFVVAFGFPDADVVLMSGCNITMYAYLS